MFGLAPFLDYKMINSGNLASQYMHVNVCNKYKKQSYNAILGAVPGWIYRFSFFIDDKDK